MTVTPRILTVGTTAPTFRLPASDGTVADLKQLVARGRVVLFFYPKADTPGCTTEACGFRDALPQFDDARATVLGISPDLLRWRIRTGKYPNAPRGRAARRMFTTQDVQALRSLANKL